MKQGLFRKALLIMFSIGILYAAQAHAEKYEELVDYIVLDREPLSHTGPITVEEAFWYGCPHCNSLHPFIKIWLKTKPDDISFEFLAIPGVTENNTWTKHAKLFYAIEFLLKKEPSKFYKLHDAIFHAIHVGKKSMLSPNEIAGVTSRFGISQADLSKTLTSFPVRLEIDRARKDAQAYQISGVPALIVDGKYVVTNVSARGNARMIRILNYLIERVRKDRSK